MQLFSDTLSAEAKKGEEENSGDKGNDKKSGEKGDEKNRDQKEERKDRKSSASQHVESGMFMNDLHFNSFH